MNPRPAILWLRHDLRLSDNPALEAAAARGPVIPVYILDDAAAGDRRHGGAARWWLHGSLESLARALTRQGATLVLRRGDAVAQLAALAREVDAQAICCNRSGTPWGRAQERALAEALKDAGRCRLERCAGAWLLAPERLATQGGQPYRVFTPFWKALAPRLAGIDTLGCGETAWSRDALDGEDLDTWALRPRAPDWAGGMRAAWQPGEASALERLERFVREGLDGYATRRDRPDLPGTSRLSPHLHHGELGPRQAWVRVRRAIDAAEVRASDGEAFLRELGWREFCVHLLWHFPALADANFRNDYDAVAWRDAPTELAAWQRGRTGYPAVDAAMRELWTTGWMHNRMRMVAASFLVKHLLIDWRVGERWFWDTLVDADLASNAGNWQWVAGTGADAAPYFRVFNPVTQGRKFDPDGTYVRRWIPEIAALPDKHLHEPWLAPADVLARAGVRLGESYPLPIVEHRHARERVLEAFARARASH